jgi:MFS family permease
VKPVTEKGRRPGLGRGGVTLLVSATVSRLADSAASVALVLLIIARTHDPRLAGLVVSAFALPTLVTGPVLGAYLDRMRAKRALFAGNQLLLAATLAAALLLAGHAPGEVLVGLGLLAGITAPVLTGGFSSLVPLVVPRAGLLRANALDSASYDIAGMAGLAIVAGIAVAIGAGTALGVVAAIAAGGFLLVMTVFHGPDSHPTAGPMPPPPHYHTRSDPLVAAVRDGLRLLGRVPLLRATTISTTISQFGQGLLPVTLPLLAIELRHSVAAGGWFFTTISAGGLAGSLASERLLARYSPGTFTIVATACFGACLAAVALVPSLTLALVLCALAGFADGPVLAATLRARQLCVPARRYAQISATAASIKTGSYALGAAAAGLLAGTLTARQLMLTVAGVQVVALVPFGWPGTRQAPGGAGSGVDVGIAGGQGHQVARRAGDDHGRLDGQVGPDVDELAGGQHAPAALPVQPFGGDDHGRCDVQRGDVHR